MDYRTARLAALGALLTALLLLIPYSLQQLGPDELLQPLLVALANHAAALGLGSALLSRALPDDVRRFTWGWPLGLFVFGLAQMALSHAGLFNPIAALGLWVVGGLSWLVSWRALRPHVALLKLERPIAIVVCGALALTLYRASVEPLFHDSLLYHLGVLTQMGARGAAITEPHVTLAAMTMVGELCSSPAYLIGGEVAFSLSHALAFFALVTLVADACRRHLSPGAAPWCALFIATMPVAVTGVLTQKSDTLFALGAFWMLDAFASLLDDDDERPQAAVYGFALAAAMTASTKYIAAGYVFFFGLAALFFARKRLRAVGRRALLITTALLATGGLVYLRNLAVYGDPLFPLGHSYFGGPEWSAHAARLRTGFAQNGPFRSLGGWAQNLWRIPYDFVFTLRDPTINDLPGVGVVVLPPLLLLTRSIPRALKRWLVVAAALAPLWLYLSPYVRFFPFGWLVLGVACGAAVHGISDRFAELKPIAVAAGLILAAHSVSWSIRADEPLLHTSSGLFGIEDTLERRSSLHPLARAFNFVELKTRPSDRVLVASDGRMAYLRRPALYSDVYGYPRHLELVEGAASPEEAMQRARDAGVRAVVVAPGFLKVLKSSFRWPDSDTHEGWRHFVRALGKPDYQDRYGLAWILD
jgi:4-amino-4-deoxy-L-arabinose transferase-like glycosyltransferase